MAHRWWSAVQTVAVLAAALTLLTGVHAPTDAAALPLAAPLPPPQPGAAAPAFGDIPPDFWAAAAIGHLAAQGILQGVAPGRFEPAAPVSRAELAASLLRLRGTAPGAVGPAFVDVRPGDWFYDAASAAAGLGWMQGVTADRFGPDQSVTRAEAAVTAARYLGLGRVAQDEAGARCDFSDCADIPAWASGAVAVTEHLGVLVGDGRGRFLPAAPLERAEAAALLAALQGTSAAACAAEAGRVAVSAHLDPGAGAVGVGGELTVRAFAHDAAGHMLPTIFTWGVSGPGTLVASGDDSATVRASAVGGIEVTATTAGGRLRVTKPVAATAAAAFAVTGLPPAGLAHARFPIHLTVLTSEGQPDPAYSAGIAMLTATPADGLGDALRTSAPVTVGTASLPMPDLPVGRYTLTVAAPGVPPSRRAYAALRQPVGALRLDGAPTTLAYGAAASLNATAAVGTWPLLVTATQNPAGPPALTGEGPPSPVVGLAHLQATITGTAAAVATVRGLAPGTAAVTVAIPGGALRPATAVIRVQAGVAFAPDDADHGPITVDTPITLHAGLPTSSGGTPTDVGLEPVDPAGHPLPLLPATVRDGTASVTITPRIAGRWRFRWMAPGLPTTVAAPLLVLPGTSVRLVVDPAPTSILLPGQAAELRAWLADAHGNPVPTPFRLEVRGPTCTSGAFRPTGPSLSGPGAVGTFLARSPGTCTLTLTSPDHPATGTATVVLRTVASTADAVAGKGLWLTFPDWQGVPDAQLLATAAADGATHLYLEVATTADGFYGGRALDDLLPQAHADGIAVIAWVYAALEHPAADAATVRQVADYITPTGDLADGLALDLEEHLVPADVAGYARAAASALGAGGLVVGITWAPQQHPGYPYKALAPEVGAFAPMDYWHVLPDDYSYSGVYQWVRASVQALRRQAGRPAVPVDVSVETFDWFAGGTGIGLFSPTAAEVAAAMRAAADAGAAGVSFYRPTTATPAEQAVIAGTAWPPAG